MGDRGPFYPGEYSVPGDMAAGRYHQFSTYTVPVTGYQYGVRIKRLGTWFGTSYPGGNGYFDLLDGDVVQLLTGQAWWVSDLPVGSGGGFSSDSYHLKVIDKTRGFGRDDANRWVAGTVGDIEFAAVGEFGVPLNIKGNDNKWWRTGHLPGYPVHVRMPEGRWQRVGVIGNGDRYYTPDRPIAGFVDGGPGFVKMVGGEYEGDPLASYSYRSFALVASSTVRREYADGIFYDGVDYWDRYETCWTFDMDTVRYYLDLQGAPYNDSTVVKLIFWVTGTHYFYDDDVHGTDSSNHIGAQVPIYLDFANCDSSADPVSDPPGAIRCDDVGPSTSSVGGSLLTNLADPYVDYDDTVGGQEVYQPVVAVLDMSVDRYDFRLWVDNAKDDLPSIPSAGGYHNFRSYEATSYLQSVWIEGRESWLDT